VLFFSLAEAYISNAITDFTKDTIDEYLPGKVHEIAVALTWIPEPRPPKSGSVELGDFAVSKKYKDNFLHRLEFGRSSLRALQIETPAPVPIEWEEPTPASIIQQFQDDTKLSNTDIVHKMNQLKQTCDLKTFLRIKHPPELPRNPHIETILKLHAVIVAESPDLFRELNYRQLFWRRKQ
jgi:hypothetical protein